MSEQITKTIRVVVDPSGAQQGANKIKQIMNDMGRSSQKTQVANDNLGASYNKLNTETSKALSGVGRFKSLLDGMANSSGKTANGLGNVRSIVGEIGSNAEKSVPGLGSMNKILASIGTKGGVIAAVGVAIAAIGVASVSAAAKVQTWEANLTTVTGSTEKAKSALVELMNFASTTPFDAKQAVTGFIKLRALGLSTSKDIMTSYGNTAAAMGYSMEQMIEAVADATTGEFERLKAFGIKASAEGNKVKFNFQGVTKEVGKNAKEIEKYLIAIGQNQFGGAMARQAATAAGALSSFQDQIFQTAAAMGDGYLNAALGKVINAVTNGIKAVTPLLSGIMDVVGGIVSAAVDLTGGLLSAFTGGTQGANTFKTILDGLAIAISLVGDAFAVAGSFIGQSIGFIGDVTGTTVGVMWDYFSSFFHGTREDAADTGQSMGESLMGMVRAAQYVAGQMSNIFAVLLGDLTQSFKTVGAAFAKAFTGDFSGFSDITFDFSRSKQVNADVTRGANATYNNRTANRRELDNRLGRNKGNISYGALGNPKSDNKPKSGAAAGGKTEKDFWKELEEATKLAALMPLEAEKYTKQLELQKILGRELNTSEQERLSTELQRLRTNKFITAAKVQAQQTNLELSAKEAILAQRLTGMSQEQAEVEEAKLRFRNKAIIEGEDITSEQYRLAEANIGLEEQRGQAIKKSNEQLAQGVELLDKYRVGGEAAARVKLFGDQRSAVEVAYNKGNNGGRFTLDDYKRAIAQINKAEAKAEAERQEELRNAALDKWLNVVDSVADVFGGKMVGIADKISEIIGSLKGESGIGGLMKSLGLGGQTKGVMKDWFGKDSGISKQFNEWFGKNGTVIKGLGDKLGAAGAGAQVGEITGSIMKGLGIKTSGTGAKIGGAIGGAFLGPLGAIGGSILGGLVGGLFKKTKYATASISMMAGGELGVGSLTGNNKSQKGSSNSAAGAVIGGLEELAAMLGGSLTGSPSVSIGTYKGKWRVSTTGYTGKLKGGKNGVVDFGKDGAEEAIKFAIQDALKDGVITGISEFSKRVLKTMDVDKATSLASSYEAILKDLANFNNPIKGAVDETVKSIDTLIEQMKKAGATTTELAKVEEWRSLKLKDVLEDQLSGFKDILKQLDGDAGGFSVLTQLNRDLSALNVFKADVAAGKAINQEKFTELANSIIDKSGDLYGNNSSEYQRIVAELRGITNGAIDLVNNEFLKASATNTTDAVNSMANAVVTEQSKTNDLLRQILLAFGSAPMLSAQQNAVLAQLASLNGARTSTN